MCRKISKGGSIKNKDRIVKGTLPYFLTNNATFAGISTNKMNVADRAKLLKEAKAKYNSYKADDWIKAGFDEHSGGYCVYHKDHLFDPTIGKFGIPRGDYEKNAAKVLSNYGMDVVLNSEKAKSGNSTPDGLLNDILFEIKGIEGKGSKLIRNKLSKASSQGAEAVVFYFHDKNMFDVNFVRGSYEKYLTNSKSKKVRRVYCVAGKYLYKI
ncbi:MAG: hypothetical protein LBF08_02055 [Dysgonamonadaceae bacterium]|jgi:hypothetical protein|nr:hypothetical protein [Dysgonamonadaceae bacterium]